MQGGGLGGVWPAPRAQAEGTGGAAGSRGGRLPGGSGSGILVSFLLIKQGCVQSAWITREKTRVRRHPGGTGWPWNRPGLESQALQTSSSTGKLLETHLRFPEPWVWHSSAAGRQGLRLAEAAARGFFQAHGSAEPTR